MGLFQHTAARRRLGKFDSTDRNRVGVSTHSRPKAAGATFVPLMSYMAEFQHTAARRRLGAYHNAEWANKMVSTHSRPKAAGEDELGAGFAIMVSTHSRPKAAGIGKKITDTP